MSKKVKKYKHSWKLISDLIAYVNNARVHSDEQIEQIVQSINEYGFTNPILISDHNVIIAGHGRLEAAIRLGMEKVPVLMVTGLSADQIRAYVIADNRLALNATWNEDMLARELTALSEADYNLDLIGFGEDELRDILKMELPDDPTYDPNQVQNVEASKKEEEEDCLTDADQVPEPPVDPVTKRGYIWVLGNHRLMCGDSTSKDDVKKLMAGEKAMMVFTDPPYNVKISGLGSAASENSIGKIHGEFKMASCEMSEQEFTSFLRKVFTLLVENSTNESIHYVCMDWRHIKEVVMAADAYTHSKSVSYDSRGGEELIRALKNLIVWNKNNGGMGSFYRSKHELIFVFKNGTGQHKNNFLLGENGRYRTNVWDYPIITSFGNREDGEGDTSMHPTVKPVKMVADACLDCSDKGDIILDLFGGSGTTLIACEKTSRKARLMELDPKYCDVIVNRWEEFTGKKAKLLKS